MHQAVILADAFFLHGIGHLSLHLGVAAVSIRCVSMNIVGIISRQFLVVQERKLIQILVIPVTIGNHVGRRHREWIALPSADQIPVVGRCFPFGCGGLSSQIGRLQRLHLVISAILHLLIVIFHAAAGSVQLAVREVIAVLRIPGASGCGRNALIERIPLGSLYIPEGFITARHLSIIEASHKACRILCFVNHAQCMALGDRAAILHLTGETARVPICRNDNICIAVLYRHVTARRTNEAGSSFAACSIYNTGHIASGNPAVISCVLLHKACRVITIQRSARRNADGHQIVIAVTLVHFPVIAACVRLIQTRIGIDAAVLDGPCVIFHKAIFPDGCVYNGTVFDGPSAVVPIVFYKAVSIDGSIDDITVLYLRPLFHGAGKAAIGSSGIIRTFTELRTIDGNLLHHRRASDNASNEMRRLNVRHLHLIQLAADLLCQRSSQSIEYVVIVVYSCAVNLCSGANSICSRRTAQLLACTYHLDCCRRLIISVRILLYIRERHLALIVGDIQLLLDHASGAAGQETIIRRC